MDIYNTEPKDWLTARLNQDIENQEWDKLVDALPTAENVGVSPELLEKAWILVGDYFFKKSEIPGSILAYNRSRKFNSTHNIYVFDKIIESIQAFFLINKSQFSRSDLIPLITPLESLLNSYLVTFGHSKGFETGTELLRVIKYRIDYVAQDAIETRMSFHTQKIINALDQDVPMKQVHQDIAKILLPAIRKKLKEGNRKDKKGKDGKGSK